MVVVVTSVTTLSIIPLFQDSYSRMKIITTAEWREYYVFVVVTHALHL